MKNYKYAIVGATGLVGRTMIQVLEEKEVPAENLKLLASERSVGEEFDYMGTSLFVEKADENSFAGCDFALFAVKNKIALELVPAAVKSKCIAIDNSSAWRMNQQVPLVVPEVNPDAVKSHQGIIANPNCSTIQLVSALKPIADAYGLKRVIVSTYQSISGAGQKGVDKLTNELQTGDCEDTHPIAFNTIFHSFAAGSDKSEEEIKMLNETRKILSLPNLPLSVTCVRLPIFGGHGESINLELEKEFDIDEIRELFNRTKGIVVMDNPSEEFYPTVSSSWNQDEVFIGRIRRDDSIANGLQLWVTADNLRKGAATNAVQIAEYIIDNNLTAF